ncbi:MAG: LysE family transporter [Candidatus Hodarchaeota archaeon]
MSFLDIFILAFLVALSGTMAPGPLLTYTIYKSIQAKRRAFLVGIFICIGHAFLEFVLVLGLIFGVGPFISNTTIVVLIGLVGGGILVFFGITLLKDLKSEKIVFNFLNAVDIESEDLIKSEQSNYKINKVQNLSKHPIIGGVLVSMSNPYWWLWWAVIGLNFITQFSVTLANQINFWSFFLGHEAGDFIWYCSIETIIGFSNRFITKKIYIGIIIICSVFMIGFGIYLAFSPIIDLFSSS